MAGDLDGALWVSWGPGGLWKLRDGVWSEHGGIAALRGLRAYAMVVGADRSVWFGSVDNTLAVLRDDTVLRFGQSDGIDIGIVLQIVPQGAGAWLGGERGLAWFDGTRAHRVASAGNEQLSGTTGIVITSEGHLWAHTARGLFFIERAELARARTEPGYQPQASRFDENDGLSGSAAAMLPLPSLVRTSTGELVVSTVSGVFHFDLAGLSSNRLASPVHVTAVAADGKQFVPAAGMVLTGAPDTVRIDYTALSLTLPQRVRFRYRLDGVDQGWQDVGTRRAAFYTQLAPGRYTFQVKAANEDGLWNEQGARLTFDVPPTPMQTIWFKLVCLVALILTIWALHRLRLKIALKRQRLALEVRVSERERIARDLHDTLLQSVQGLILNFRRIANRTPADADIKPLMKGALALATEVLVEGRNKVGDLRQDAQACELFDVGESLQAYGQRLAAQYEPLFILHSHGSVQPLHPAVHDEVLSIVREAIQNAYQHAQASAVTVELDYDERQFAVRVADDGVGIEPQHRSGRPGHWGILGMSERAAQIGATFDLDCPSGGGCVWHLRMPASQVHATARAFAESTT